MSEQTERDNQVVEQYLPVLMRYLPLLRLFASKPYGWFLVQVHGKKPVRYGYLPGLEAVEEGEDERGS